MVTSKLKKPGNTCWCTSPALCTVDLQRVASPIVTPLPLTNAKTQVIFKGGTISYGNRILPVRSKVTFRSYWWSRHLIKAGLFMLLLWNLSILDLTRLCRRGWSLHQGHCDMFFGKTLCSSLVTGINRYWQSIKVTSWVECGIRWTPLPGGVVNSPNYFMWQMSQFIMCLSSLCHLLTLRREGNYCTSSLRIKQHY